MRPSRRSVGVVTVLCAALAACSSGDDGEDTGAGDVADLPEATGAEADRGEVVPDDGPARDEGAGEAREGGESADAASDPPICEGGAGSGSRRRWADPVTGHIFCEANCRDCEAVCVNDGTRSEGWYAECRDPAQDGGCGDVEDLIAYADCV
jgi:hypothetical protein